MAAEPDRPVPAEPDRGARAATDRPVRAEPERPVRVATDRPVRAALTMTVPTGSSAEFERRWARVASWVRRQPGCLRQSLTRTAEPDITTYVITSDWVDRATFQRFETSSRQDEATAGLRALRTSVRMEILEIIDHRDQQ